MLKFNEYIAEEASTVTIEVNTLFADTKEQTSFKKDATKLGFTVEFSKNSYAETAQVTGKKSDVVKFLKSKNYSAEEMKQL